MHRFDSHAHDDLSHHSIDETNIIKMGVCADYGDF